MTVSLKRNLSEVTQGFGTRKRQNAKSVVFLDLVLSRIATYLNPQDLAKFAQVNGQWNQISNQYWETFDLLKHFPSLSIIDQTDWKKYFDQTVIDPPTLNKAITAQFLESKLPTLDIKNEAGVTLLMIPKGLTFLQFQKWSQNRELESIVGLNDKVDETGLAEGLGKENSHFFDESLKGLKSHYVMLTNHGLRESFNRSLEKQAELVKDKGFQNPGTIELSALFVFQCRRAEMGRDISKWQSLFYDHSSLLSGDIQDNSYVMVGDFARHTTNIKKWATIPSFYLGLHDKCTHVKGFGAGVMHRLGQEFYHSSTDARE